MNLMSQFLKEQREKVALTQRKASELLGYRSSQFLSNVERGLSKPPVEFLNKLCAIYGVPEEEMFKNYLRFTLENAEEIVRQEWASTKPPGPAH